ncbi:MAG TPA: hypothetical protein VFT89_00215, partial [Rhizobiaceae bacterium]|nr:hypothetical protein [Rhizobiaceae bacterium]
TAAAARASLRIMSFLPLAQRANCLRKRKRNTAPAPAEGLFFCIFFERIRSAFAEKAKRQVPKRANSWLPKSFRQLWQLSFVFVNGRAIPAFRYLTNSEVYFLFELCFPQIKQAI